MLLLGVLQVVAGSDPAASQATRQAKTSPIQFELEKIPFRLENDETPAKNAPEAMAGGVAVFDYNGDGRPESPMPLKHL